MDLSDVIDTADPTLFDSDNIHLSKIGSLRTGQTIAKKMEQFGH